MNETLHKSLARGIDWLIAQQAVDGGWHSATYGQLKDGAAVTALVLDALSHLPAAMIGQHEQSVGRGFAFLDRGLAKRGTIASPDGSLDFPTYATALWLTSRQRLKRELPDSRRKQLRDYLLGAQVAQARGFAADSPSYGGWDFLGPGDAHGITTGTNISVTRYVAEALAAADDDEATRAALDGALRWTLRCQDESGGFAFTCEPMSLSNKAAYADDKLTQPRPYGSATCDGIRALVACGMKADEERVVRAITWLVKRPALEVVPGFEGLPPEAGWQRGLRYYYYAGLAHVLRYFPAAEIAPRREALSGHLIELQRADGSWLNESDRMRENDPLIATALAVTALAGSEAA